VVKYIRLFNEPAARYSGAIVLQGRSFARQAGAPTVPVEIFTLEFFTALAAIVAIDLVLAGDNAIVIALAARNLPPALQRRAMIWGAVGAVAVRSSMTVLVVWLLQIPGLLFAGGVLLVWIAYRLLLPDEAAGGEARVGGASTFWGAIRTIVIADMVMGLDNVLGVAGAAHGSFLLVVLGLVISVPILIWGSSLLLGFIERYPAFVYVGAGVLALTAVKMVTSEPWLKEFFAAHALVVPLLYVVIVAGVLWAGFVRNHRHLESRITARLALFAHRLGEAGAFAPKGDDAMLKVLIPVGDSRNALYAAKHVAGEFKRNPALEVHLLNVQPRFSQYVARFVSKGNRDAWHRDEAERALRPVRQFLDNAGVPYAGHTAVGDRAELIADWARRLACDHIVMSTTRKNSLTRMIEDSVTNKVLELTSVPVEVIAGDAVSRLERYGVPAGLGAAIALLVAAAAD
jgi:YjbE family integral membrane protein